MTADGTRNLEVQNNINLMASYFCKLTCTQTEDIAEHFCNPGWIILCIHPSLWIDVLNNEYCIIKKRGGGHRSGLSDTNLRDILGAALSNYDHDFKNCR